MDKRTVFLFGAGAMFSWGGPSTEVLTTLIRTSGFKTTDNETTITEFIFQQLIKTGIDKKYVNFETIIGVLDELISYYARFDSIKDIPPLLKDFLTPAFEDVIFNYSVTGGRDGHGYQLQIPAGQTYAFSRYAYHKETPHQFFLQHLLADLITYINARISEYAYHSEATSSFDLNSTASQGFVSFMETKSKESTLRMYTLNYDRVFKVLLERNGISIFEGFEAGEIVKHGTVFRANVPRILSDKECHVHYNLHGSAFWELEALDQQQLPNPEFFLSSYATLPINDDYALIQIQKGKTMMVTNIVTGYQKAVKTLMSPLKQMLGAFDYDCCFADEIYVIGYSLGDEHINESIKTAMRHNQNLKLYFIDPGFTKNDIDFDFAIKLAPYRNKSHVQARTIRENVHEFLGGDVMLYTVNFETFLDWNNDPTKRYNLL